MKARMFNHCRIPTRRREVEETIEWIGDRNSVLGGSGKWKEKGCGGRGSVVLFLERTLCSQEVNIININNDQGRSHHRQLEFVAPTGARS